MSPLSHIHSITSRILNAPKNASGELFTACDELYKALLQITGIDVEEEDNRLTQTLNSGNAIGLTWAAMCIKDYKRTKRFMDGIYEATIDKLKTVEGRPVHILYAGTGPFATLVLPLTARFTEEQIKFTLLEVNEPSFNCLQKLTGTLQMEKYISNIQKADATKWELPQSEPVDIFISETMQQGLAKEPQVELCMNIVPQLPTGTVMIPQQITLTPALINPGKRMQKKLGNPDAGNDIHLFEPIFTLNKKTTLRYADGRLPAFPETTTNIPAALISSYPLLYLLTDIIIYKKEKLLIDNSQLTLPLKLAELNRQQPVSVTFQYHLGTRPGMRFSVQCL
ncbi:MAG: hypothetical protein JNM14_13460 [Ferruginibacter sp.]|nr:hypothetical protein [Ferruginibacter sp.]